MHSDCRTEVDGELKREPEGVFKTNLSTDSEHKTTLIVVNELLSQLEMNVVVYISQ
jgi:hypothetical protein